MLNKIKNWKILKKLNESLTVIIVIGILITLNFLSCQIFQRWDLTAAGNYSISKVSKKAMRNLDDVVNIKIYFSKNLPAKYLNLQQEVKDILFEFANYSGGKVRISSIDPASLANAEAELGAKGIPALEFNVARDDSFQSIKGYLGIVIEYGGREEVLPIVQDTQNFEYDVMLAIKKLTNAKQPVLGVVSSHGTSDMSKVMTAATDKLAQIYQIKPIDLAKADKIDGEVDTLLIAGPRQKFTEQELKKIDQFVMRGKSLVLLVDGVILNDKMAAQKNELGLEKLLDGYGLKVNYDLVADTANGRASISSQKGNFYFQRLINYPLWPRILPNNFNSENVIVSGLQAVIFPWASSISFKPSEEEKIVYLARTTAEAITQSDNYILDPEADLKQGGASGAQVLAVYASGKLSSPFGQGSTDKARIVLVGDSDFATDKYSNQSSDNLLFFQNIVDGLTLDNDLINIRAKTISQSPIKAIEKKEREKMRYFNIFGATAAVLIIGAARYFWRRKKSKG